MQLYRAETGRMRKRQHNIEVKRQQAHSESVRALLVFDPREPTLLEKRATGAPCSRAFIADQLEIRKVAVLQTRATGTPCSRAFTADLLEVRNVGVLQVRAAGTPCPPGQPALQARGPSPLTSW